MRGYMVTKLKSILPSYLLIYGNKICLHNFDFYSIFSHEILNIRFMCFYANNIFLKVL